MTFTLERRPRELVFRRGRLAARTELAPGYVRVRIEGEEFTGFDSPGADDHIRVFFGPDGGLPSGAELPSSDEFREHGSREYTPVAWGDAALELEFLLHGDGPGASWAASAPVGAPVAVGGPRGSMHVVGTPDAWFLAGDETAMPAIRRYVELAGADAAGTVILESADAAGELPLEVPAGISLVRAHRDAGGLAPLIEALTPADRPAGEVFGFIAAEQAIVKPGRALLHERWALEPAQTIVKGYWKRGDAGYHAPH
ncbi:siderophore-interacting protein [Agromyces archimandritae]|uniref:Siderophore-interacting protein n=1 Tax=Agromyces archimandritae TaxID=2781962 RepID=A0A975FJ52_9MICO|nr:siderophore-interacting protein [Agromyces archimandritae]QTX03450.1 siderophore-interacting protein [Agromyces archimandritae]